MISGVFADRSELSCPAQRFNFDVNSNDRGPVPHIIAVSPIRLKNVIDRFAIRRATF